MAETVKLIEMVLEKVLCWKMIFEHISKFGSLKNPGVFFSIHGFSNKNPSQIHMFWVICEVPNFEISYMGPTK